MRYLLPRPSSIIIQHSPSSYTRWRIDGLIAMNENEAPAVTRAIVKSRILYEHANTVQHAAVRFAALELIVGAPVETLDKIIGDTTKARKTLLRAIATEYFDHAPWSMAPLLTSGLDDVAMTNRIFQKYGIKAF